MAEALEATRAFGERLCLPREAIARLCIVVEELLANVYDHGGVTEQDAVSLKLARDPEGIVVSIADPGVAFNPWSTPTPNADHGGGAGVRLIRAWARLIRHQSSPEGNQLELRLPLD